MVLGSSGNLPRLLAFMVITTVIRHCKEALLEQRKRVQSIEDDDAERERERELVLMLFFYLERFFARERKKKSMRCLGSSGFAKIFFSRCTKQLLKLQRQDIKQKRTDV